MPKLNWDANDFNNSQDSSGTTADNISHNGNLQQGYKHGSLTEGLVAYYPMDSGSGNDVIDKALDNDGAISGASWSNSSKIGASCLSFDGQDDYVRSDNLGRKELEPPFTFSAWFYSLSGASERRDIFNAGRKSWGIRIDERSDSQFGSPGNNFSSGLGLHLQSASDNLFYVIPFDVPVDSWHLVTAVFDGEAMRIYQDGKLENSYSFGQKIQITNNGDVATVGNEPSANNPWNGRIDDLRIYERPLSVPEIKALYELRKPSTVSPKDSLQ